MERHSVYELLCTRWSLVIKGLMVTLCALQTIMLDLHLNCHGIQVCTCIQYLSIDDWESAETFGNYWNQSGCG